MSTAAIDIIGTIYVFLLIIISKEFSLKSDDEFTFPTQLQGKLRQNLKKLELYNAERILKINKII